MEYGKISVLKDKVEEMESPVKKKTLKSENIQ